MRTAVINLTAYYNEIKSQKGNIFTQEAFKDFDRGIEDVIQGLAEPAAYLPDDSDTPSVPGLNKDLADAVVFVGTGIDEIVAEKMEAALKTGVKVIAVKNLTKVIHNADNKSQLDFSLQNVFSITNLPKDVIDNDNFAFAVTGQQAVDMANDTKAFDDAQKNAWKYSAYANLG